MRAPSATRVRALFRERARPKTVVHPKLRESKKIVSFPSALHRHVIELVFYNTIGIFPIGLQV